MTRLDQLIERLVAELARQGHGSKGRLAQAIGVSPNRVSEWLAGTHQPSAENALAILEWLERPAGD